MIYSPSKVSIPSEKRASLNEKCFAIASNLTEAKNITKEHIYQAFTGKGGLHGLNRKDYANYAHFSDDKKSFEIGQFFTPDAICKEVVEMLEVKEDDLVCDPTCGKGSFLNYLPNINNAYGNELDMQSFKIASYLFDSNNISNDDITYYNPRMKFDYIVGNPPFNLRLKYKGQEMDSQQVFFLKCAEIMFPGAIVLAVVPSAYLMDNLNDSNKREKLEEEFGFIGQMELSSATFKDLGVSNYATKIIAFQKKIEGVEFNTISFDYVTDLKEEVKKAKEIKRSNLLKISAYDALYRSNGFQFKVDKYLFEIKRHAIISSEYKKALSKLDELENQTKPEGMSSKEWERSRMTEAKVLSFLKRIVKSQERKLRPVKQVDKLEVVKYSYGIRLKAYSNKSKRYLSSLDIKTSYDWAEICQYPQAIAELSKYANRPISKGLHNLIKSKVSSFKIENTQYDLMNDNKSINNWLNNFSCLNKDNELIKLKSIQKEDLALQLQKQYSLLNWQQGSGKSIAGVAAIAYRNEFFTSIKNTVVVGPAIAIKMTWKKLLDNNHKGFKLVQQRVDLFNQVMELYRPKVLSIDHESKALFVRVFANNFNRNIVLVKSARDITNVKRGDILLLTMDATSKYKRELKNFVKSNSQQIHFVLDESDEISNVDTRKRKSIKAIFRKVQFKLLTTGTATRNNIVELYPQLELMYNNSQNLLSLSENVYHEEIVKELVYNAKGESKLQATGEVVIKSNPNPNYGKRYPAYAGHTHFKACFNPSKTTVFGIKKHNQDLYNTEELARVAGMAILTRSFKDIVGPDRYQIESKKMKMNEEEYRLYSILMEEFYSVVDDYFTSTGDSRKDGALRIIRQIGLLRDACSIPQKFDSHYCGGNVTVKMQEIIQDVREANQKTIIGTTSIMAVDNYYAELVAAFPDRQIFKVTGSKSFSKRDKIIKEFESQENAIIICTQQSLSSSVDIPSCNLVICESMQWNFPRMEQFYFRAIRLTSKEKTRVVFYAYENSIEQNILGLLLSKEKINEFIKTRTEATMDSLLAEYGVDDTLFDQLIEKRYDEEGKLSLDWGSQKLTA